MLEVFQVLGKAWTYVTLQQAVHVLNFRREVFKTRPLKCVCMHGSLKCLNTWKKKTDVTKKCVCCGRYNAFVVLRYSEAVQFDKAPPWVFECYLVLNKIAFWKTHLSSRSTMLLNLHFHLFFVCVLIIAFHRDLHSFSSLLLYFLRFICSFQSNISLAHDCVMARCCSSCHSSLMCLNWHGKETEGA